MAKQERKVLRQPFIDILFKNNKFTKARPIPVPEAWCLPLSWKKHS